MSAPDPLAGLPRENVFGHAKKARLVLAALGRLRAERGRGLEVLDVGCGNGEALTRFLGTGGDRVLGIDTHGPSIEYATRNFGTASLEFRQQAAESLLGEGRSFDAILFADVLEHLGEPAPVLEAGARLLRPDGRVLVSVPNGYGPFEIESWLSRLPLLGRASLWAVDHLVALLNRFVFPGAWTEVVTPGDLPYNEDSGHVQFYTRSRLLALARRAGLDVVGATGLSWLSGPYTNYLFAPVRRFCDLNARLADLLPPFMLSAWFFEFGHARPTPAGMPRA
ncbi:MAG TPA: methyltransferase domain-containing protein [Vicinamibacteria bacterium]|nr:methyltransferase domain-containing protein [Vicinamibacteria bacterium]